MRDLYAEITDDIIAAIEGRPGEGGADDFVMPWHGSQTGGCPKNALTNSYYHGINFFILMMRACRAGYGEPIWAPEINERDPITSLWLEHCWGQLSQFPDLVCQMID